MAEVKQMTHFAGSPNRLVASIFTQLEEFLKKVFKIIPVSREDDFALVLFKLTT